MKLINRRVGRRLLLGQVLSSLTVTVACQATPEREPTTRPTNQLTSVRSKRLEKQLTDSLRKYWHLTEFVQRDDNSRYVVYGAHTEQGRIGFVALTDSVLLLYQAIPHGAQLTNRILFPDYASQFKQLELNGDSQPDFIIYGMPNRHGQSEPFVFLSQHGILHYRPDLKQYDLAYDAAKELVSAYYAASGNSVASKELYRWQGDSLRQVAGADFDLGRLLVTVYRLQQGKRVNVKTYYNPAVYDTVLFRINGF